MQALTQPHIQDREALLEFLDALTDLVPGIERNIAKLKHKPDDKVLISDLFRGLHTIKGDAALCKVEMGVLIAHPLETLLGRLRNREIGFSNVLAEAVLLVLDRLELATRAVAEGRAIDHLRLADMVAALDKMADVAAESVDASAAQLIESVTGFKPASLASSRPLKRGESLVARPERAAADLAFFQTLALQYEARSPLFKGRSERQLRLALDTNEAAGRPIDPLQLEAAVLMHDIGMQFLPESVWLKAGHLSDKDRRALHAHPGYGAGLLQRMPGWEAAAEIVLQHHERRDGAGYPRGLKNEQILPGAKLLSIVDTFESVTLKHNQRGEGRSLVRAIAEVNACDDQFDPQWIAHFNTVLRRMLEG